jgi:hypothetical protein
MSFLSELGLELDVPKNVGSFLEALYYKPEGRCFDSRRGHGIFLLT